MTRTPWNPSGRATRAALAALALVAAASGSRAQDRTDPVPEPLVGVGIDELPEARVDLDLAFTDDAGRPVRLRDYAREGRPILLTLNYYRCPMLCTLALNGLVDGLKDLAWTPGGEFQIVTVSIDPNETPALARGKKANYLESLGRPGAETGWHFLTGLPESIKPLAASVGFRYTYDPERNEFAHAAAVFVLTPEGRVSRVLYGVLYDPRTLRLALVEASQGRIGTTLDRLILYCYHYDPSTGTYAPQALAIMRAGAVVTILVLGGILSSLWIREARRRRRFA